MRFEITEIAPETVKQLETRVEDNSKQVDTIVSGIVTPYCKDLDRYVSFIAECLKDGQTPPTTQELEDFCMNLSTYIYFAGGMCENLGIRDDIAKAVYKEVYNSSRNAVSGTVQDKNTQAELHSQEEQIISICYTRAYKIMKSKIESAQELLQSCKKVLSHRMQEEEMIHMGMN